MKSFVNQTQTFFFTLVSITVVMVFLDSFLDVEIDNCLFPRFHSTVPPPTLLGAHEFHLALFCLVLSLVAASFLSPSLLPRLLLVVLAYAASNVCLEAAKVWLADTACSRKPNSVSGHASFFLFYSILLLQLLLASAKDEAAPKSAPKRPPTRHAPPQPLSYLMLLRERLLPFLPTLQSIATWMFWVFAGATLISTLRGGYHSFRQMLYGFVWGAFTAARVLSVQAQLNQLRWTFVIAALLALSSFGFWVVYPNARHPLSFSEFILCSCFFGISVILNYNN